jgi:hypothetical protein
MSQSPVDFNRVWPQRGKFHVVHTGSKSVNANGVAYVAIALFDPSGRYVIPFAINKGDESTDDDYTHRLRRPATGELAADFTPDFVFGGGAFGTTNITSYAVALPWLRTHGSLTSKLGIASTMGPDADRIQTLNQGSVQFGNGINGDAGDVAFWGRSRR